MSKVSTRPVHHMIGLNKKKALQKSKVSTCTASKITCQDNSASEISVSWMQNCTLQCRDCTVKCIVPTKTGLNMTQIIQILTASI